MQGEHAHEKRKPRKTHPIHRSEAFGEWATHHDAFPRIGEWRERDCQAVAHHRRREGGRSPAPALHPRRGQGTGISYKAP